MAEYQLNTLGQQLQTAFKFSQDRDTKHNNDIISLGSQTDLEKDRAATATNTTASQAREMKKQIIGRIQMSLQWWYWSNRYFKVGRV